MNKITLTREQKRKIKKVWEKFLVWKLTQKGRKVFWYDSYHNHVEFEVDKDGNGTASFDIRLEDSCMGDTWLHVTIGIWGGCLNFNDIRDIVENDRWCKSPIYMEGKEND